MLSVFSICILTRRLVISTLAAIHHNRKTKNTWPKNKPSLIYASCFFKCENVNIKNMKALTLNKFPKLITFLGSSGFSFSSNNLSPYSLIISQSSNISLQTCWVAINPLLSDKEPFSGLKWAKRLLIDNRHLIWCLCIPSIFFFGNVRFCHVAYHFAIWKRIDCLFLQVLVGEIVKDCYFGQQASGLKEK